MATGKVNIILDGKKIDPYRLSVEQRCDAHHQFEIAVSTEKIEGKNSLTIDNSVEHIGQSIEISIKCAGGDCQFKGLITRVHIDRTYTGDSLIILSGHSYTYLLEDGIGTKSYEEKSLADIANEILGTYPSNMLNPSVSPQYTTPIPYVVRYKETNYQFLARLASIYGEWFYYDGSGIVFGKLPNPESITVTLGKDLSSFDYGVQMRPSKFKYQFYNYIENRVVENVSTNYKPGWLDNYGKKALDAADGVFPNEPVNPVWHDAPNHALIKHLTEAHRGSILSDSAFFKGQSTHAGIHVGARIRAKGINKSNGQNELGIIGNFRVTAVTHHLDANKDYSNSFEAIPLTVTAPPTNKNVVKPEAESQVAVVKENYDPEGLGRIRAQFKWQTGDEMTPWIRVVTSSAAGGRGMYFIPEIGDEVYIGFDQGNPDRPYSSGALFHGNAKPIWKEVLNAVKALRTRSGHQVALNDGAGKEGITINDISGNMIQIDTAANSITITALEDMTLNAKNLYINVDENMTTDIGKSQSITIGENNTETVTGDKIIKINGNKTATISGDDANNIKGKLTMKSDADVLLSAAAKTTIKGDSEVKVGAAAIKVNGSSTIRVSSNDTEII